MRNARGSSGCALNNSLRESCSNPYRNADCWNVGFTKTPRLAAASLTSHYLYLILVCVGFEILELLCAGQGGMKLWPGWFCLAIHVQRFELRQNDKSTSVPRYRLITTYESGIPARRAEVQRHSFWDRDRPCKHTSQYKSTKNVATYEGTVLLIL